MYRVSMRSASRRREDRLTMIALWRAVRNSALWLLLSWHFDSIQFLDRPLEFIEFRSGFCELTVGSQTSIIGERPVGALDQRLNGVGRPRRRRGWCGCG